MLWSFSAKRGGWAGISSLRVAAGFEWAAGTTRILKCFTLPPNVSGFPKLPIIPPYPKDSEWNVEKRGRCRKP